MRSTFAMIRFLWATLLVAGCGGDDPGTPPPDSLKMCHTNADCTGGEQCMDSQCRRPTSTSVTVAVKVTGEGSVKRPDASTMCDQDCSTSVAVGTSVSLEALPATDGFFDRWSGGCTGTEPKCTVTVSGDLTVQAHFRKWTLVPSGTTESLRAIWGRSASEIWTVGTNGKILRFDGMAWKDHNPANPTSLYGLHGDGSQVFVVGDGGLVLSLSGSVWQRQTVPTSQNLRGVYTEAGTTYAVGAAGTVLRRSGSGTWTPETTNVSDDLQTVRAAAPGDLWTAGRNSTLLHLVSGAWKPVSTSATDTVTFNALAGVRGTLSCGANFNRVFDYVSSAWTLNETTPAASTSITALFAESETVLWAASGSGGELLRRSHGKWITTPHPSTDSIYGIFAVDSSSDLWAVGAQGRILRASP